MNQIKMISGCLIYHLMHMSKDTTRRLQKQGQLMYGYVKDFLSYSRLYESQLRSNICNHFPTLGVH